jgi:hypothetical protein
LIGFENIFFTFAQTFAKCYLTFTQVFLAKVSKKKSGEKTIKQVTRSSADIPRA